MPALEKNYDIIIIGAGPAGASFARLVDSEKYKVLLLDGSLGGEKVCGGLLSASTQDVLARYNISLPNDILATPQLFNVKTVDLRDGYTRYYKRGYINVSRRKFDGFLIGLIPDSVHRICAKCKSVVRSRDGFEVEIDGEKVYTKYVVGADGASSIIRRSFYKDRPIKKYTAIQQWFDAGETAPFYSCVFDNKTSDACSWIFFKDGKLVFGGAFSPKNSRAAFEAQKSRLVELGVVPSEAFSNPIRTEACQVCCPKALGSICTGDGGVFLLGEAAGFISSNSFEGISYALLSAEALAEAFNFDEYGVAKIYKKKTRPLKRKVFRRGFIRPFMTNPVLRRLVMKSGITSIKTYK